MRGIRFCLWLLCICFVSGCGNTMDPVRRSDIVVPIGSSSSWGAMDLQGNVLVPPSYRLGSSSFVPASDNGVQFAPQEGILLVSDDEWCYVNGQQVRPFKPPTGKEKPLRVLNFGESLFGIFVDVTPGGKSHRKRYSLDFEHFDLVYDPYGLWRPPYRSLVPHDQLSEGLLPVSHNGRCGYADRRGAIVIPLQFESARAFSDGLAAVMQDGLWGYIDRTGSVVIQPQFTWGARFVDGVASVTTVNSEEVVFVDRTGKEVGKWPFPFKIWFSEGLAVCRDQETGLQGYRNMQGEWVIPPRYQWATQFREGLAGVCAVDSSESGFIDATGQLVLSVPDLRFGRFHHGLARVSAVTPAKSGYIDRNGNWLWRER
jgi:hypothetical protein